MHIAGAAVRNTRPGYSVILEDLIVGEFPNPDDIAWLVETAGVDAVLSLQDEADLLGKGLDADRLIAEYTRLGIAFRRVPIADCDRAALTGRLSSAVATLAELTGEGRRVYVHCNAGMNRAPTVTIAYLCRHRGYALEEAYRFVKSRRACVPYMTLLREWVP